MPIGSLVRRVLGALPGTGGERGDDRSADGEESSVWSAVPYAQWGRFGSSGVSKAEQADEVRKVTEEAAKYEDAHER